MSPLPSLAKLALAQRGTSSDGKALPDDSPSEANPPTNDFSGHLRVEPPPAPNERAHRRSDILCGCNILACLLALLMVLPHVQPFHPSLLLYVTVWLWWSTPLLLAMAFACVTAPFCTRRCTIASSPRSWRRLCLLAAGPLVLAFACVWVLGLEEHGFLNAIPLGETGFLKLCYTWCGGGPWAIRSPCYQQRDLAWRNATSATEALAFFQRYVFGPAGEPVAAWDADGRITLSGLSAPVAVQRPGRRTLLISSGLNTGSQNTDWSHIAVPWERGRIIEHAARLNAVAALLRDDYEEISVYGCSMTAKAAYLAAATARPGTYSQALIDSGGALGPASVKVVGPCGETWAAMVGRRPQWVAASAHHAPPPSEWPADVGDLIVEACKHTRFRFGVGRYNHWNNYRGTMATVNTARSVGCTVDVYEGYVAHCGYFFPGTCSHSC